MYILLGIFVIALGALMLISPKTFFELTESWKSDTGGEPSDLYIFNTRLLGALFLVVGMVCLIILLFVD